MNFNFSFLDIYDVVVNKCNNCYRKVVVGNDKKFSVSYYLRKTKLYALSQII